MIFYVADHNKVGFQDISDFLATLLRELPQMVSSNNLTARSEERLFPSPTEDLTEPDFDSDWNAFVQPDLLAHFQATKDVVKSDLRQMEEVEDDTFKVEFSTSHIDAWINTLNQARLILAAEFEFEEADLISEQLPTTVDARSLALIRIHFYGFIQQCLIEELTTSG